MAEAPAPFAREREDDPRDAWRGRCGAGSRGRGLAAGRRSVEGTSREAIAAFAAAVAAAAPSRFSTPSSAMSAVRIARVRGDATMRSGFGLSLRMRVRRVFACAPGEKSGFAPGGGVTLPQSTEEGGPLARWLSPVSRRGW